MQAFLLYDKHQKSGVVEIFNTAGEGIKFIVDWGS